MQNRMKFRAWDKKKKQMFDVVAINYQLGRVYETWNDDDGKNLYVPFEDVILMQYISEMDEMGNELFEGDVIKVARRNYDSEENEFDYFDYLIKWDNYYSGYEPFQDDYSYPDEGFFLIGNMFEDKSLERYQEEFFRIDRR